MPRSRTTPIVTWIKIRYYDGETLEAFAPKRHFYATAGFLPEASTWVTQCNWRAHSTIFKPSNSAVQTGGYKRLETRKALQTLCFANRIDRV